MTPSQVDRRELADDALLLRRAQPRAMNALGGVKPNAFTLRLAKNETELSFYDGAAVSAEAVLIGAPGPGWGVVGTTAGALRELGCTVVRRLDAQDEHLGDAHVAVVVPRLESDGQIQHAFQAEMAHSAFWVFQPARGSPDSANRAN